MALLSSLMCLCRGLLACGAMAAFLWGGGPTSDDTQSEDGDEWHIV